LNLGRRIVSLSLLVMLASLVLACGATSNVSIPGMPDFAATDTQEAVQSAGTPAAPLSGDWATTFEGGKAVFHIARDGSKVKSVDLQLQGWHCGGTTLTTTMSARSSGWDLQGDSFSITIDLNPPHIEELSFDGKYDAGSNSWSGTWEGDEYGTHCGGDWKAAR
jgi:hypothetical protein